MNSIKRAYFNLKSNMSKTILQIVIFSVVFAFIVACLIIYQTADDYVKTLEMSVKNAVTVSGVDVKSIISGATTGAHISLPENMIEKLIDVPYLKSHNYSYWEYIEYRGKYHLVENSIPDNPYSTNSEFDATIYTVVNSKYDYAFTVGGYNLVEGRHVSEKEQSQNVGLVSKEFAQMNDLSLGDEVLGYTDEFFNQRDTIEYRFEIIGIFEGPDGIFLEGYGSSPTELIIMPTKAFLNLQTREEETLLISLYFETSHDAQTYVKYVEDNFNVRKVFETRYDSTPPPVPKDAENFSFQELMEYYYENLYVDIKLDTEWYEMVAEPIERVRDLSSFVLIGFVGGAILILVLVSSNSIKKRYREFGVLLSMGESKANIVTQIYVESLTIIVVSALIGFLLGVTLGVPTIRHYTSRAYEAQLVVNTQVNALANDKIYEQNYNGIDEEYYSASYDLSFKMPNKLSVAPNIIPTYNLQVLLTFIAFAGVLTIISALIQTIYITRIKPTVLLTSRR